MWVVSGYPLTRNGLSHSRLSAGWPDYRRGSGAPPRCRHECELEPRLQLVRCGLDARSGRVFVLLNQRERFRFAASRCCTQTVLLHEAALRTNSVQARKKDLAGWQSPCFNG